LENRANQPAIYRETTNQDQTVLQK